MVKSTRSLVRYSDNEPPTVRAKWKRQLLAERGGCEVCKEIDWKKLEIHHKVYRPIIERRDISLLCRQHHKLLHEFVSGGDKDLPRFTDVFIAGYREAY